MKLSLLTVVLVFARGAAALAPPYRHARQAARSSAAYRTPGSGASTGIARLRLRGGRTAASGAVAEVKRGGANSAVSSALLVATAALYGSLAVCLKGLYGLPGPPTPAALSFVRQLVTAACFAPLVVGSRRTRPASAAAPGNTRARFWRVATELAFWNFASQGLSTAGLELTTATREAFFRQLSVVLTPCIALARGESVGTVVRAACGLALAGILVLSGDSGGGAAAAAGVGFNFGDLLVLGSAATWSLYIVRLGDIARFGLPDVDLQAAKTALMVGMYGAWAYADWALRGGPVVALWPGWADPRAWALLAFSGVFPGALADVWMQRGAAGVSASAANVLLSAEPLFAAVLARVLLGEVLGPRGAVGAALVVAAAVIAGLGDREEK